MIMLKKILVPRDFSDCSEDAVHYALDLARRLKAEIHLVFVEVLYADAYAPTLTQKATDEVLKERLLQGVCDDDSTAQVETVCAVRRDIAAAPAIVNYAEENDIDVIVMGTHGRRGLRRWVMGSAAEEVVRTAPCPVLVTRCAETRVAEAEGQNTILVPIDFSRHSRYALRHAKELAGFFHARLDVLHVVEEQLHPTFYNTGIFSIYDMVPDIELRAMEELKTFFKEAEGPEAEAEFHIVHGNAAHEIVDYAKEQEPVMVVMATHGLKGIEHFLLGSVAEKVVRFAPSPVFTVKAFDKKGVPMAGGVEDGAVVT